MGTNPTLRYSDTTERRLSIHLGLFTEESYTNAINTHHVLWSQVGLGWKTEAMSAFKHLLRQFLKATDKNRTLCFIFFFSFFADLLWFTLSYGAEIHS